MGETVFGVSCGILGHSIYAGRLNEDGTAFTKKTDVTNQAVGAVAQFLAGTDEKETVMTHKKTGERYRISVEVLPPEDDDE